MTDEVLLVIVGVFAPFVIQGVKLVHSKITGGELTPASAMGWTYAICLALAVLAKGISGELFFPVGGLDVVLPALLAQAGVVLGLATFVYKAFLSGDTAFLARR